MKAVITFNWRGHHIEEVVDFNLLKNDINEIDDFWGEFSCCGINYQYQIHWNSNQIAVFIKDAVEIYDYVNAFQLHFSSIFK